MLISAVTALMGREWTLSEVGGILDMLFEKQYILTETVTTETRYRTETRTGYYTDADGNLQSYEYDVQVPYTYYICTVRLENFNLSHVPVYIMSQDQLSLYAMYMAISEWEKEYATLSGQRTAEYTKLKETRAEVAELHNIRKCVDIALKADQPEQTRAKRHDLER